MKKLLCLALLTTILWANQTLNISSNNDLTTCRAQNSDDIPTSEDFTACYNQNKNAFVTLEGVEAIAISADKAVSFTKPKKFIKYDPYLKLYLIQSLEPLHVVSQNEERALQNGEWLGAVARDGSSIVGKLVSLGVFGDRYTIEAKRGEMVTGVCCDMYGISMGGNSFIGNRYLEHLLAYERVYYGSLNATFAQRDGVIVVTEVDPFKKEVFRVGDEVLLLDGVKVEDFRAFRETILFAKPNQNLIFQVKRGQNTITLNDSVKNITTFSNRTYLEALGLSFDSKMNVTKVDKDSLAEAKGIKVKDRLMQLNSKDIRSVAQLRAMVMGLSKGETHHLLFDRENFQFFVGFEVPRN